MKKIAALLCTFMILSFFVLGSCNLFAPEEPEEDNSSIHITSVGWAIETLHQSFWKTPIDNFPTVRLSLWIYCEKTFSADKVDSVQVFLPGGASWWALDKTEFDPDYSATRSSFGSWQRFTWSGGHQSMPIGFMTAKVVLTNGASDTRVFEISRPGSLSSDGYDYVSNLELLPSFAYDRTLALPTITEQILDIPGGTVSLTISIDDARVVNGYIIFFDSNRNYLGRSDYVRDPDNGAYSPALNGGSGEILTNGSPNTILIPKAYLDLEADTFELIDSCHVILTDGQQYEEEAEFGWWDYLVVSERVFF